MTYKIRPLEPEDYADAARIFFCAVHDGARQIYTWEQRRAWAGDTIDLMHWKNKIQQVDGFLAEELGEPIGFMTIDATGYLDLAFVLPSCARQGIGQALLSAVEEHARGLGATTLTTAASLIFKPLCEKCGWQAVKREQVERNGVILERYQMRKILSSGDEAEQP